MIIYGHLIKKTISNSMVGKKLHLIIVIGGKTRSISRVDGMKLLFKLKIINIGTLIKKPLSKNSKQHMEVGTMKISLMQILIPGKLKKVSKTCQNKAAVPGIKNLILKMVGIILRQLGTTMLTQMLTKK